MIRLILQGFCVLLPWTFRRTLLTCLFGYRIHPTAWIGLAWVFPRYLEMAEGSRIDHLNVAVHLDRIVMGRNATIGRGNWITGFPKSNLCHFRHVNGRDPSLLLGEESAITKNHHLDCTATIEIGRFVTIAGYGSQFLTHSIDIDENRQDCAQITIGDYCFVGTGCTVLGGARLPNHSVLAAKSLLSKELTESYTIFGGVPARPLKRVSREAGYFRRTKGKVD